MVFNVVPDTSEIGACSELGFRSFLVAKLGFGLFQFFPWLLCLLQEARKASEKWPGFAMIFSRGH